MAEPTIRCPQCSAEIPLTESLAAPLLKAERENYERQLAKQNEQMAQREADLRRQKAELEKSRQDIDEQVEAKVKAQREAIREDEKRRAQLAAATEVEAKARE